MMRKFLTILLAGAIACSGAACSGKKKKKVGSNEKKKAAARVDAVKQYQTLVAKYPDSEFAPKAKERLNALTPKK